MYFLSGEATCLNVMPACLVMSVNAILMGCWLRTRLSCKGAKTQRRPQKVRIKVLNVFIGLLIAPCLLILSTARAVCRRRLCVRRQSTRGRADNEHAPDQVAGARQSRGSQHYPLRRLSVATLCRARNARQRSQVAHVRSPASS